MANTRNRDNLHHQIVQLKYLLASTAKKYEYDFMHPEVLAISQQLDCLIMKAMRNSSNSEQ